MSKQTIRVTYLLALIAGGLISLTQPPVRWAGLALLIVAFGLPLASRALIEARNQVLVPRPVPLEPVEASLYQSLHVMTGGTTGEYYIDIDSVQTNPAYLPEIGARYVERIQALRREGRRVDRLAFIERDAGPIGAVGLLGLITERTNISSAIVRPRRLLRRGEIKPAGAITHDSNVVLVTDAATGGGTIRSAVEVLRRHAAQSRFPVILLAYRQEDTYKKLREEGVDLYPLYDLDTLQQVSERHRAQESDE